ncbi:unnamed protein product [Cuscuta campestris]|uniref:Glycine-rich protein n=1 Tax=Cuscuta campestris TaxID=132261 RepID=A0A484MZG3_9ASTE|nr:unnamed protein product [Cuscuta campestris]
MVKANTALFVLVALFLFASLALGADETSKDDEVKAKVLGHGGGYYGGSYGGGGGGGHYGGGGGHYGGGGGRGYGGHCRHCCGGYYGGHCSRCCGTAEEALAYHQQTLRGNNEAKP